MERKLTQIFFGLFYSSSLNMWPVPTLFSPCCLAVIFSCLYILLTHLYSAKSEDSVLPVTTKSVWFVECSPLPKINVRTLALDVSP